jgi:hypothetical protein
VRRARLAGVAEAATAPALADFTARRRAGFGAAAAIGAAGAREASGATGVAAGAVVSATEAFAMREPRRGLADIAGAASPDLARRERFGAGDAAGTPCRTAAATGLRPRRTGGVGCPAVAERAGSPEEPGPAAAGSAFTFALSSSIAEGSDAGLSMAELAEANSSRFNDLSDPKTCSINPGRSFERTALLPACDEMIWAVRSRRWSSLFSLQPVAAFRL